MFNNGVWRPEGYYSSVDEITTPIDQSGGYFCKSGQPFGPDRPKWSYTGSTDNRFFATILSSASRLKNGNTLICSGMKGIVFESAPDNTIVWKYKLNEVEEFTAAEGDPPKFGRIVVPLAQDLLGLSDEQRQKLSKLDVRVSNFLEAMLELGQKDELARIVTSGVNNEKKGLVRLGEPIPAAALAKVSLSGAAVHKLEALGTQTEKELDEILEPAQRELLNDMRRTFAKDPSAKLALDMGYRPIFRALRYGFDYPAFKGKNLEQYRTQHAPRTASQ